MRSPSWSKVIQELWRNKTRSLLVISSIMVGIFALGMTIATGNILEREMMRIYQASQPANLLLNVNLTSESTLALLRSLPEVKAVDATTTLAVRVQVPGVTSKINLNLVAYPDFEQMQLDLIRPESGAWPPPAHEIMIERAALSYLNAQVGDTISIELPDGTARQIKIAGLVYDSSKQNPTFTGGASGYVTTETLTWLGGPQGYNEFHIALTGNTDNPAHIRQVGNQIVDKVGLSGVGVKYTSIHTASQHPLGTMVQGVVLVLTLIGVLTIFLGSFLIMNSLSALLLQQVSQIGVMKALGARQDQIMRIYLNMVILMSLCALVIGIPLSAVGAQALSGFIASLLNLTIQDASLPLTVIALQIVIGLGGPVLAALYPVWSGTNMTVREALTSYSLGSGKFGASRLDNLFSNIQGVSNTVRLAIRNVFRRKKRLAFTLATLVIASAIFISVLSVRSSLFATLDETKAFFADDLSIEFTQPYPAEQIIREVAAIPGVVKVETWGSAAVRPILPDGMEGDDLRLFAPPADTTMLKPKLLDGRWLQADDRYALVINTYWQRIYPNIKVGDEIKMVVKGKSTTWQVVGIIRGIPGGLVPSPYGYVNYTDLAAQLGETGLTSRVEFSTAQHDYEFQSKIADALETRLKKAGFGITSIITAAVLDMSYESAYNVVIIMLLVMAILLSVVGSLGLAGTMSMNVLERTREIGVLRAIGASNSSIFKVIVIEGVFIGVLSWVIGTILALFLSQALTTIVGNVFTGAALFFSFSVTGTFMWLFVVIILSALSSLLPAWNATRFVVREALAYE